MTNTTQPATQPIERTTSPVAHVDPGRTPRAPRRAWIALAVLMLPVLLVSVDNTVLSFALPAISRDLAPTAAQQLWIIDAYPLVLAGLLVGDGQRGRPLRAPSAAADRLDRVRRGVRRRRVRADRRGAHRRARRARLLRRHAHAVDAVAAPRRLHRPRAAPARHRDLGLGLRGRQRARPARRRTAARALRLGLGVPARRAGARADARARAAAHPREPRPRAGPHRPR